MTFNTPASWALGPRGSRLVGVVAEGIGKRIPMVTMPCVNRAYVAHPRFERSTETGHRVAFVGRTVALR
ncbi:hypothetical protein ACFZCF_31765 [Streptomyces sp. NPDC007945]|uniref:hypothetical protein n=1 Tax=Streptomyces sp. NPDC007945 TaxID=3364797 RepID=UPI0036EDFA8A